MTEQEIEQLLDRLNNREGDRGRDVTLPLDGNSFKHISQLADSHNADLPAWSVRRHRRESIGRIALASVMFIVTCMAWSSLMARPAYDQITTTGNASHQQIYETVTAIIGEL